MLAMMTFGVVTANADEEEKVYATFENPQNTSTTWDAATKTFTWTATSYNQLRHIGLPENSDLTYYIKLVVDCTIKSGEKFRILFYKGDGSNTTLWVEKSGVTEFDLSTIADQSFVTQNSEICLSGSNQAASGEVVINSVYLVKSPDPLAVPRINLQKAINNAKNYSPYGKTESSVEALEEAVKAGEEELKVGDSQYESPSAGIAKINAAKDAIDAAIAGLELKWGYFSLTKEMFKEYASVDNPGEGMATGCGFELRKSSGLPYGDGGVNEKKWADLAAYDKLVVITSAGTPRIMLNRIEHEGNIEATKAESKMIEINQNTWVNPQCPWAAEAYQTKDESGKIFTIDLNKIVDDWGFARLHSIKGQNNSNVTVSDILLYIDFDNMDANEAVKANRQMLKDAIDQANAVDLENVTSESAAAMKEALAAAMALIFKRGDITMVPTMDAARRNLFEAIENLVEAYKFDASFYHNWSEVSATAEDKGVVAGGGVKLNEDVAAGGAFWGNLSGAVPYLDYANITDYSELRFEGTPGAQLRLMCNRLVDEGPIFEKIYTIGSDGRLTVKISDLKFLNGGTPCDFVCLQAIKVPWGGSTCKLTSIQILKGGADEPVVTGLQTVKAAVEGEAIYSISGQRLAKPVKGLNIINGKKVVIK